MPRRSSLDKFIRAAVVIGLLVFLWVLYFWRLFPRQTEDRHLLRPGDFTLHYFNFTVYQAERLWQGELPLWNPYNYAGEPFVANIQRATWYPLRWAGILLAGRGGWDIQSFQLEVAFHYLLAGLLAFAFLRIVIGRVAPALVGGILFAYGGYLIAYPMLQVSLLETSVWLPVILSGLHLSVIRQRWQWQGLVMAGIGLCLAIFAGHLQGVAQMTYLGLAYLVFAGRQHHIAWHWIVLRGAIFLGIGAGLAAVQLVPAIEYTKLSSRTAELSYQFNGNGFAYGDLLSAFWPHFGRWSPLYAGTGGILLAIGAVLRPRPAHLFWTGVMLVSLWLGFGRNSILYDVVYVFVPGMDLFRQQERVVFLFAFALSVLAAYQVDWLLYRHDETALADRSSAEKRFDWLVRGHLGLSIAVLLNESFRAEAEVALVNRLGFVALVSALFAAWVYWQRNQRIEHWQVAGALVALTVVDLFSVGIQNGNFVADTLENRIAAPALVERLQAEPDAIVWRVDGAAGLQGYGTYFQIPDIYGAGPLALDAVTDLYQMPVDHFWEIFAVRYVTTSDIVPEDKVALTLLALSTNYDNQEYRLYEIENPRPFAHLVYDYRYGHNPQFAREIMAAPEVNLRELAIVLDAMPFELPGSRPANSNVSLQYQRPERLTMIVSTSENALLTIAMPKIPGWRAYVNGDEASIINTYAGLIGIPMEPGDHQVVRLEYHPQSLQIGIAVSVGTMVATVLLSLLFLFVRSPQTAAEQPV